VVHRRDITGELEANRRFEALLEAAPDAMILLGESGRMLLVNAQTERMFGYPRGQIVGLPIEHIIPGAQGVILNEDVAGPKVAEGGRPLRGVRRDGTELPVQVSLSPVETEKGRMLIAAVRDVTLVKDLEEKLLHAQKMEAIGRLAGGIAHDFNNLLSVIMSYCQIIPRELTEGHPVLDAIDEIRKAGARAADLTAQLLAFGRRQMLAPRIVDLSSFITDTEKLLRRLVGEDITVIISLAPNPLWLNIDRGLLSQVVINLAVNARDAMLHGGRLTIETFDVAPVDRHAARVGLSIRDTGVGISNEVRARIFEPYFTTKGVGKGTGLGLATVLGIVEQSGGSIDVESAPGAGTAFRIFFPRAAPDTAGTALEQVPGSLLGDETVVLVEDEAPLRAALAKALRQFGYIVLVAARPEEALELALRHPHTIHLFLTDVVMPQTSGPELARAFVARRPSAKVLFMSGYTEDAILRRGIATADVAFVAKPVTPEALARKVREVLDALHPVATKAPLPPELTPSE
jgi:PAS domain S-box-containing protein